MDKHKFRRWMVEQKVTLGRGYQWANIPMMGMVVVSAIKVVLPRLVDTFWKFAGLTLLGILGLYFIGWIDRRYRFFDEESDYVIEKTPHMMKVVNKSSLPSASNNLYTN